MAADEDAGSVLVHNAKCPTKWLNKGKADTHVYQVFEDDRLVYVGITKNVKSRQSQHRLLPGRGQWDLERLTTTPLTRHQARAVEQSIIAGNSGLKNKINSISPKRDIYEGAVNWGDNWRASQ